MIKFDFPALKKIIPDFYKFFSDLFSIFFQKVNSPHLHNSSRKYIFKKWKYIQTWRDRMAQSAAEWSYRKKKKSWSDADEMKETGGGVFHFQNIETLRLMTQSLAAFYFFICIRLCYVTTCPIIKLINISENDSIFSA